MNHAVKFTKPLLTIYETGPGGRKETERRSINGRRGLYTIHEIYLKSHSVIDRWHVCLNGEMLANLLKSDGGLRAAKALVNKHDAPTTAETREVLDANHNLFHDRNAVRERLAKLDNLSRNGFDMNAATMSAFLADLNALALKYTSKGETNTAD